MRKGLKYLCHVSVVEWFMKLQIYVYASAEKFSTQKVNVSLVFCVMRDMYWDMVMSSMTPIFIEPAVEETRVMW